MGNNVVRRFKRELLAMLFGAAVRRLLAQVLR
jgi:hypothetical protein